jgi:hypothetical protein
MSELQAPKPAKLVIGLFTGDLQIFEKMVPEFISTYGQIDLVSPWMAFNCTRYYEMEMGTPLYRRLCAFQSLIAQHDLAGIKMNTHQIEKSFSQSGRRRVNIDPGYMLRERFVLASGKNFSHRICVGDGIYADLTLIYHKGDFQRLPWTYPDYANDNMLAFLKQVRNKYIWDIKNYDKKHDSLCKR